ncbi:MAG TPA: hypothetical protein VG708_01300 [Mycobacteriales bacterium]|nr:hypothetical protein [Mycobacteriales bacterium]
MSTSARAGAAALIVGPLLGLIGYAVVPTVSDDASDVVPALHAHHAAMIAGLTLQTIGIAILVGGLVWLAIRLVPAAPRLATVAGVLGVAGALVVIFENGLLAAAPPLVSGLDGGHATTAVDQVSNSAAAGLDPVGVALAIGIAALGFAAVKAGAPRWIAPVLTAAALVQTVGFAAAARPLVLVGFAALVVLFGLIVRALQTSVTPEPVRQPAMVA